MKLLLLSFSNQSCQTIILIPILNLRSSKPTTFISKANNNATTDGQKTHASKKSSGTHSLLSSLLHRIVSTIFPFLVLYLRFIFIRILFRDFDAHVIPNPFLCLVCRSRMLRQPKDLALIKSTFNSLKSCETHFDFDAISQNHGFASVMLSLFMLIICYSRIKRIGS